MVLIGINYRGKPWIDFAGKHKLNIVKLIDQQTRRTLIRQNFDKTFIVLQFSCWLVYFSFFQLIVPILQLLFFVLFPFPFVLDLLMRKICMYFLWSVILNKVVFLRYRRYQCSNRHILWIFFTLECWVPCKINRSKPLDDIFYWSCWKTCFFLQSL